MTELGAYHYPVETGVAKRSLAALYSAELFPTTIRDYSNERSGSSDSDD